MADELENNGQDGVNQNPPQTPENPSVPETPEIKKLSLDEFNKFKDEYKLHLEQFKNVSEENVMLKKELANIKEHLKLNNKLVDRKDSKTVDDYFKGLKEITV